VTKKATTDVDRALVIKETRNRIKNVCDDEVDAPITQPVSKKVKTQDWDDLDAEDGYDPCMVAEYVVEIFEYMKKLEVGVNLFHFLARNLAKSRLYGKSKRASMENEIYSN
jgi:hypothetical protein